MRKLHFYISFCVVTVIIGGVFSPLFAAGSTYTGEIDACRDKRDKKMEKTIEDYVCPTWPLSIQEVAFQVVMSLEFKKLDDKVKKDLKSLHEGTNKDVGQLATDIGDLFDAANDKSVYPAQYSKICNETVMSEVSAYFTEKGIVNKTSESVTTDNNSSSYVYWQKGCQDLVNKKLLAYKDAAWLLGESAIVTSFKNDKHDYMRKLKDQYEKFLNKWTTYLGQLGVIKDKWPSKSAKVQ